MLSQVGAHLGQAVLRQTTDGWHRGHGHIARVACPFVPCWNICQSAQPRAMKTPIIPDVRSAPLIWLSSLHRSRKSNRGQRPLWGRLWRSFCFRRPLLLAIERNGRVLIGPMRAFTLPTFPGLR